MALPGRILFADIYSNNGNGNKVRVYAGDRVAIMPADLRLMHLLDRDSGKAEVAVKKLQQALGTGPLEIVWIGRAKGGVNVLLFSQDKGASWYDSRHFIAAY